MWPEEIRVYLELILAHHTGLHSGAVIRIVICDVLITAFNDEWCVHELATTSVGVKL